MAEFPRVSEPLKIKGVTIPNRLVFPPFVTGYSAPDGSMADRQIEFFRRIAGAGVGLTIIGASAIAPNGIIVQGTTRIDDDRYIPGLKRVFDVIREEGSVPGIQIVHSGRQTNSKHLGQQPVGPSAIPCPYWKEMPRALATEEVEMLEDAFAQAVRRALEAGAEFIQLHAAHGYLLCQFLSPLANARTDQYGGSLENRARFSLNSIDKARDLVGEDPVIGFRISADEFMDGGLTLNETRVVARKMVEHGSDYVDVSAGSPAAGQRRYDEMKAGTFVRLAGEIKKEVDVPVIAVGYVTGLDRAEEILAQGTADLVAIGRALVADHDIVKKYYNDQVEDVVECTHCGQCLQSVFDGIGMTCPQNPDLP